MARDCVQANLDISSNYTRKCKSASESARVGQQLKLYVVMQNSYLKDSDFKQPIQKYLTPYQLTSAANHSMGYYIAIS